MVYYTEVNRLNFLFEALSHQTRRELIATLTRSRRPVSISDFAKSKRMSYQNAGKHVKLLERAKLVRRKKRGVENYLYLNEAAMAEAEKWIEQHRKYWNKQFDAIEKYLKREKNHGRNN